MVGRDGAALGRAPDGKPRAALTASGRVDGRGLQPDGKTVLTGGLDGTARLWDAATARPRAASASRARSWPWPSAPTARPSSRQLGTARAAVGRRRGHPRPTLERSRAGQAVAFSPDGKTVATRATGQEDGAALGRRRTRHGPIPGVSAPSPSPGAVYAVALSPDGKTVADGQPGRHGAALGRGQRHAHRPALEAPGTGHGRGLQPRRQDRPHRQRGRHGAAVGRRRRQARRRHP